MSLVLFCVLFQSKLLRICFHELGGTCAAEQRGAVTTLTAAFAVVGGLNVCKSSWSSEKSELSTAGVLLR